MIIGVILSLGWAARQGVNITLDLELEARLDYLEVQQQLLNDTINNPINSTISAMIKSVSYIVSTHGSYYCLINGTDDRGGRLESYSTNASAVINDAVANGQSIHLKPGYYSLNAPILIAANGETGQSTVKTIEGETLSGDAYFTKLQTDVPEGTVLAAAVGYTGSIIEVGYNAAPLVGVRNLEISHLTISGLPLPNAMSGGASIAMASDEAGIKATNLINAKFHDLTIINCYTGIYLTTNGWTNDGIELHHIWAGYNNWAFYSAGQTQVLTIHDTYTYLNYMGGYYIAGNSVDMNNIFSNADSWENETMPNSAMILTSNGFIRGRGIYIQNGKDGVKDGSRGINLNIGYTNATIDLSQVVIQGVNGNGIVLTDNNKFGYVFLNKIYCSPSTTGYLGGEGDIKDYGFTDTENDGISIVVSESIFKNCGFGGLVGDFQSVSQTYNNTYWIGLSPQNSNPYSYVVWSDGTNYYLGNGTTGHVDFQSTNASLILEYFFAYTPTGGSLFVKSGSYTDIHVLLPTATGTWMIKGEGKENTILNGLENLTVIDSQSSSWDATRVLILEDVSIYMTGTLDRTGVDFQFWNVHITRCHFSGVVGVNSMMLNLGGAGAPASPSSIIDCAFTSTGGMDYSYFMKVWYEGCVITNPTFLLAGNDIYGLMYILGTTLKVTHPIVHSWSGRDIGIAMFHIAGAGCSVSIDDIYYNHSGATAPTYKVFRVDFASSTIYSNNIRVDFENDPTQIAFNSTTSERIICEGYYNSFKFSEFGNQVTCINGTAIAHHLPATPTSVTFTMYGTNYINSTCWYLPPTVYSMNATHIVVCFTIFNAGTITAVATPNSRTIYWNVGYQP